MYLYPTYLPWLLAILVSCLLVWLAWRRPGKQRLFWRSLASIVAGVSLVLIVFPPVTRQAVSTSTAILLTEGYNPDTLENLRRQDPKPVLYTLNADTGQATSLSNLYTLRRQQPGLQTVHLLGYGLDEQQLKALKGVQLVPHLSEIPAGICAIQWPQELKLGETVTIAGKYKNMEQDVAKLYLHAGGQHRDSVAIKPDSTATFNLRYTPKTTGRFVYTLSAGSDTLGHVPVQVSAQQPLRILLLASAPSFEFKFLKNHLAAQQHKVAYRATVSRDIAQTEWANMAKTGLNRLTPKLLQQFDVVITEPGVLKSISAGERINLQRAVTEDGLGVLTIDSEPFTKVGAGFFTGFRRKRVSQQEVRTTQAIWAGKKASIGASPFALASATTVTDLVSEQGDNLLAGAKRAGWGKVAMSVVPQTFPWQLEGKDDIYASYWSTILSGIAKEQVQEKFWQLEKPMVPKPNQPVILSFTDYTLTEDAAIPVATITSLADSTTINLPLTQNIHQPEKYSGTFWPRGSGWYKAETPNAPPYFFYVQENSDWKHESIAGRREATEAFVAKQNARKPESTITYREEPVAVAWFFVLFVLSSAFLWLEEKL